MLTRKTNSLRTSFSLRISMGTGGSSVWSGPSGVGIHPSFHTRGGVRANVLTRGSRAKPTIAVWNGPIRCWGTVGFLLTCGNRWTWMQWTSSDIWSHALVTAWKPVTATSAKGVKLQCLNRTLQLYRYILCFAITTLTRDIIVQRWEVWKRLSFNSSLGHYSYKGTSCSNNNPDTRHQPLCKWCLLNSLADNSPINSSGILIKKCNGTSALKGINLGAAQA